MSFSRLEISLGNVFASLLPLQFMLDDVQLVSLKEAVLPLLEVDLNAINFPDGWRHLTKAACLQLCDAVLEEAREKPLLKVLPLSVHNIDRVDLVASILFYTLENPFPFYLLYSIPLNVQGVRRVDTLRHQLPFLKLLLVSLLSVPRFSRYWNEGILYRGVDVDKCPFLKEKMADYEVNFAPGTRITFAAPTSASTDPTIADEFRNGIQFVIFNRFTTGGPGGLMLDKELSMREENEVLMGCPKNFDVFAVTKPDSTVMVYIKVVDSPMTYLSSAGLIIDLTCSGVDQLNLAPPPPAVVEIPPPVLFNFNFDNAAPWAPPPAPANADAPPLPPTAGT